MSVKRPDANSAGTARISCGRGLKACLMLCLDRPRQTQDFVKLSDAAFDEIRYDHPTVTIVYTFPIGFEGPSKKGAGGQETVSLEERRGVLCSDKKGSPFWTFCELCR